MSKKLDLTDPSKLSQEDLKWAAQFGLLTVEQRHRYIDGYTGEGHTFDQLGNLKPQRSEVGEATSPTPAPSQTDEDDESDVNEDSEYSDLTKDELKEELDKRDIEYKSNAKKAELVALLDENDEEDED